LVWNVSAASLAVDIDGMDRSVKPGDDFFAYANGSWVKKTEIPADRSSIGAFNVVADVVNQRMSELISDAQKGNTPETRMVADYYNAFLDEKGIEARGLEPVKGDLADVDRIKDVRSLSSYLGTTLRADVDPLNATNFQTDRLFGVWISADFNNPTKNVPYMLQGGLGMPDRDYYLNTDEESKAVQDKYKTHIASVLKLANISDADAKASRIYDLEAKIAQKHATREQSGDIPAANNPWKMSDFATKAPGIDWNSYFKAATLNAPMIMVWHPNAVTGLSSLVSTEPISVWKEYLAFRVLDRSSGLLPNPSLTRVSISTARRSRA
jgi:predicted metalloendopeptidase